MKLIIAEKPALAKCILSAIGGGINKIKDGVPQCGDYYVCSLAGHILELVDPRTVNPKFKFWSEENLPIYLEDWPKVISDNKKELADICNKYIHKSDVDTIINAGDMDAEGQYLVDEVLEYFKNTKPVFRLNTADTTTVALKKSLNNLTKNSDYKGLGESAKARSICDAIWGFSSTALMSLKLKDKVYVGRVKTPTLNLVYERDKEIENFVPNKYYTIFFEDRIESKNIRVKVELTKDDPFLDKDGYLSSEDNVKKIVADNNNNNHKSTISKEKGISSPDLPFCLNTLQKYMESNFKFSPDKTLQITQSLRDKYNAITYNRSDCSYIPESYYMDKDNHIKQILQNIGIKVNIEDNYKSKCFNDKEIKVHFGIIPQNVEVDINKLTKDEKNCYLEICKRYLQQFMGDAEFEKTKLVVELKDNRKAIANSKTYIKLGYRSLLKNSGDEKEEVNKNLDVLKSGNYNSYISDPDIQFKETLPPKKYTQASLIADMNRISLFVKDPKYKEIIIKKDDTKNGKGKIGTPATQSSCIKTMINQKLLYESKGKLFTSEIGKNLLENLPDIVKNVDLSAQWWDITLNIEDGKQKADDLIHKVLNDFNILKNSITDSVVKTSYHDKTGNKYFKQIKEGTKYIYKPYLFNILKKFNPSINQSQLKVSDLQKLIDSDNCSIKLMDKYINIEITEWKIFDNKNNDKKYTSQLLVPTYKIMIRPVKPIKK